MTSEVENERKQIATGGGNGQKAPQGRSTGGKEKRGPRERHYPDSMVVYQYRQVMFRTSRMNSKAPYGRYHDRGKQRMGR